MKIAPMTKVRVYHSRRPQPPTLVRLPVRPTWPFSAAWTPSWQVTEERIRIVVLIVANHGKVMPNHVLSRWEAPHSHIVVAPGATRRWS